MKKILLILLHISIILNLSGQKKLDQSYNRCLTMEALKNQLENNEAYKTYYNSVYNSRTYKSNKLPPLQPVVIPIAFHFSADVINCSQESCLLDEVDDQLMLLNEAFANNTSSGLIQNCPSAYEDANGNSLVSSGSNISFCYATPPSGNAQGLDPYCDLPITIGAFDGGTFVSNVGAPGWNGILNIFIANLANGNLGVADGIPGQAIADGVTITAAAFGGVDGSTCNLGTAQFYNLGKTLVHEIGHYLGVFHTFEGACNDEPDSPGPYNVDDTPPQAFETIGCSIGCNISCNGQAAATANFMDYSNDACMGLFSKDQALVMNFWANTLFGETQYNCGNQALSSLNTVCNNNNCNIICPSVVTNAVNIVESYCGSASSLSFPNPKANGLNLNAGSNGATFIWSVNNYIGQGGTPVSTPSDLSTSACNVGIQTYYLNIGCYNNPLSATLQGGTYQLQVYPKQPNNLNALVEVTNENACTEPFLRPINGCEDYISILSSNTNPSFPINGIENGVATYQINFTPNPNGPNCCDPPDLSGEVLENENFELGNYKWIETEESPVGTAVANPYGIVGISLGSVANMNGSSDAWFGGYRTSSFMAIEQNFNIPECSKLSLSFDYKTIACSNINAISLAVYVNNTPEPVVSLNCNDATNENILTFGPIDISTANVGTGNALIRFEATETGTAGASLLIDNISLQAEDCPVPISCSQQTTASYNCEGCVSSLNLNGVEDSNTIYKAENKITSTAKINANVTYQAGDCIRLGTDFSTNKTINFSAKIDDCN